VKPITFGDIEFPILIQDLVGEATGPISGQPPKLSDSTKAALTNAAENDSIGTHTGGKDAGSKIGAPGAGEKVKSEKECMKSPRSLAHELDEKGC